MSTITTTFDESIHAGAYIMHEVIGPDMTREVVTILSGTPALGPGAVLGQITASGKYTQYDDTIDVLDYDGRETASAILFDAVDASGGDVEAVITKRLTVVNADELEWAGGVDEDGGLVDMRATLIIAR